MIHAQILARCLCRRGRHALLAASYLVVLTGLVAGEVCAQQQSAPVKVEEVAHEGALLQSPNNFSLAIDAADYVVVGGANSNNVLRIAPRGDLGRQGDAPCVAEILSATRALQDGHASHTPCPPNLPGPGFAFGGPKGIAVSSDGAVYVTGTGGQPNQCDNVVRIAPDGTIDELVNRGDLGFGDWNPGGIALDEGSGDGVYVYATGPTTVPGPMPNSPGATVRINPDGTSQQILAAGGQAVVVDRTGNVYVAQTNANQVTLIPDARNGICGSDGKQCPALIVSGVTLRCDNNDPVTLSGPYALALVGDVLYVTGQSSNNVLKTLLTPDDPLHLPLCVDEIFSDAAGSLLNQPRAVAADSSGNVFVAGARSNNVIWVKPAAPGATEPTVQEIISSPQNGLNKPEALALDSQGNVYVSGNLDAVGAGNVFRIRTVTAGANLKCGNGALDKGEACDYSMDCCCSVSCGIETQPVTCRGSSGAACDAADVCDGVSPTCTDQFASSDTVCRQKSGDCDVPDSCSGTGPDCPADQVLPAGIVCRPEADLCDLVESCDGLSPMCPEDAHKKPFSPCFPPQTDSLCAPSSCQPGNACVSLVHPDGETCGGFCNNSACQQGQCVARAGEHPCGTKELCDASQVGKECTKCGDGNVDPWEECDPGPALSAGPTEGCTQYCQAACGPSHPCAQPLLGVTQTGAVPDPCRQSECTSLGANLGAACVTKTLGCTGCQSDSDCQVSDSCQTVHCDVASHICQEEEVSGFDYYTCALVPPLTLDSCPAGPLKGALKVATRRYERAKSLATKARSVCQSNGGRQSQALLRRAKERLEASILQVVVLGFGHRGLAQCVDDVSSQLQERVGRIRDHLKLEDVRAACTGRAFVSRSLGRDSDRSSNAGVPSPSS